MGLNTIVIAGIKRSASTALYNICRISLKHGGYKPVPHGQDYEPRVTEGNEVDVVKIHPFDQHIAFNADHIFVTDRADKEILTSLDRMWDSGNPERLSSLRGDLSKWMLWTTPKHYFYYQNSIGGWSNRVIDILDLDADPQEVKDELDALEPPEEGQDPETLLFAGHISHEN